MRPSNEPMTLAELLAEIVKLHRQIDTYTVKAPECSTTDTLEGLSARLESVGMLISTDLASKTLARPTWVYADGGRANAGYAGFTGDCATRAIALAAGMPYQEAYDLVNRFGAAERKSRKRKRKSAARTGVYRPTMRRIMASLGFKWVSTMGIGSGCTVHLRADELPAGRLVLSLSKHYAAFIDGVLYDTYDSSRDGTRCVYGYWIKS